MRASEHSVKAKFAEFLFHALGRIRAKRKPELLTVPALSHIQL
jgi:hypothetical protein